MHYYSGQVLCSLNFFRVVQNVEANNIVGYTRIMKTSNQSIICISV